MKRRVQASDLSIGYERHTPLSSGMSLELAAGEFVCLLGPNGAGKSTLIRTLAGMQSPLGGRVLLGGTAIDTLAPREKARAVSVVLTDSLPVGMFTAYAVVALGRHPHTNWTGSLSARDRERIEWALDAVDASGLSERQVSELSDGERQKIMIARALAQEASVMLLDEPTAFLDLPRRVDLMRLLRDLARREKLSVLLSTHDLDLALRAADTLWLMDGDGAAHTGIPEELVLNGSMESVFRSDRLDWDQEQGSFRMHREPLAFVSLVGDGMEENWTRRALMRIGYGIADAKIDSDISIQVIRDTEPNHVWKVSMRGQSNAFASLGEMLAWMLERGPKREGEGVSGKNYRI